MDVLLTWGPYTFATGFASYEELRESFSAAWADHKIFGRRPAGQYLHPGANTVRIRGTIYPAETGAGSRSMILAMKADVEGGAIYQLVSGDGAVVGPHRCDKGERRDTDPLPDGSPQKSVYDFDFTLQDDSDGQIWSLWP